MLRISVLAIFVLSAAMILSAQSRPLSASMTDGSGGADPGFGTTLPATPAEQQLIRQNVKDIYFDFDRSDVRPQDHMTLQLDADWLKANPNVVVTIEGDADEHGEIVYNVVLSDERAAAAKDVLVSMGVPSDQIVFATGWGKLYPVCTESEESCWSQNRRAHFEAWQ